MTTERAIEILDPTHREHYDSLETVQTACRMGMQALEKQIPKKPIVNSEIYHYVDYEEFFCPCCKSRIIARLDGEFIAGKKQKHCQECGQALDFSE